MQHEILVGDLAPKLPRAEYIRGIPISRFEPGRIYVVECWATWCGPCVDTIPHLTDLQRSYPDVTIIGFAVMEQNAANVRAFVSEKGDEMDYTVAIDVKEEGASEGQFERDWMVPSYSKALPTAFIVDRDGRIAWIGHPCFLDAALPSVIESTFDLPTAADQYRKHLVKSLTRERARLIEAVGRCLATKDVAGALQAYETAFTECPELELQEGFSKLRLLLSENAAGVAIYARRLIAEFSAKDGRMSLDVAGLLADALQARPDHPEREAHGQLIVETLRDAVDCFSAETHPFFAFRREQTLAIGLSANGQPLAAAQHAKSALARITSLELSEEITSGLRSLVEAGTATGKAVPHKAPKVLCEGDTCWIASAGT